MIASKTSRLTDIQLFSAFLDLEVVLFELASYGYSHAPFVTVLSSRPVSIFVVVVEQNRHTFLLWQKGTGWIVTTFLPPIV